MSKLTRALRLLLAVAFALLSHVLTGCQTNEPTANPTAATSTTGGTAAKKVTVVVIKDASASTNSYPGGWEALSKDYVLIADKLCKGVATNHETTNFELREFVSNFRVIQSRKDLDLWEQFRTSLNRELRTAPYAANVASKTLFAGLVTGIVTICKQHTDTPVVVLVLTDGHYDDGSYENGDKIIAKAIEKAGTPGNLQSVIIAPVVTDRNDPSKDWRLKLTGAFSAWPVTVCNNEDFRSVVDAAIEKSKGN